MDTEENCKTSSSGEFNEKRKTEEDILAGTTDQANHPFDDPVQRTKCLIQYIRLRKQRAEAEQAKRNALKKQKMTARATLQSAREEKTAAEAEDRQCVLKIEELNQEKHQVLAALKAIHSRETERKRRREEAERQERQRRAMAEEQRRKEEQRRMAAQQPQQQQQQQQSLAALEYLLQLKNAQQALSAIIASATGEGAQLGTPVGGLPIASSLPPSILSLLMQSSVGDIAGSASQNVQVGNAAALPLTATSFTNFPTALTQQQQQRMMPSSQSSSTTVLNQQQSSHQNQMHLQQQQVQNAVAQLLRQQFPANASGIIGVNALLNATGTRGGQAQIGQPFPNIGTFPPQNQFDLQTLAAVAAASASQPHSQQQQQLSSALGLQALVGGGAVHQPPNPITSAAPSTNIPGFSQDLLYQALLAAANLSNPGLITSNPAPQQQQRPK